MDEAPTICVLTESPLREGFESDLISRALMREGIHARQVTFIAVLTERPYGGLISKVPKETLESAWLVAATKVSSARPNVILALGDFCCQRTSGQSGIDNGRRLSSRQRHLIAKSYPVIPQTEWLKT